MRGAPSLTRRGWCKTRKARHAPNDTMMRWGNGERAGEFFMDKPVVRNLTSQLAEDLSWLENHCRQQSDQGGQAGALRLAAAVVRNIIGPALEGQPPAPLHLAVVGGA